MGTYVLKKTPSGQFHWNLSANNNEIILSSETYVSKQGALSGIESCKLNSPHDGRYDRRRSVSNQYYFVLKAANGEVIGTSEMYQSEQGMTVGIASCKTNGPSSPTSDRT